MYSVYYLRESMCLSLITSLSQASAKMALKGVQEVIPHIRVQYAALPVHSAL